MLFPLLLEKTVSTANSLKVGHTWSRCLVPYWAACPSQHHIVCRSSDKWKWQPMVKTENILISAAHLCYTNGNTTDFYVFSIDFGQKRENYSQAFPVSDTCMHFFCHSSMLYFVWGRFLFCISSGIFNLILPHAQREFLFLLHCFRKGSILLVLSRNGLYSVRTVGLFWDFSGATSCRSTSAIKGICLTGSMCWEYEYFQWWQLRLNIFFTFLHFTREEVK